MVISQGGTARAQIISRVATNGTFNWVLCKVTLESLRWYQIGPGLSLSRRSLSNVSIEHSDGVFVRYYIGPFVAWGGAFSHLFLFLD